MQTIHNFGQFDLRRSFLKHPDGRNSPGPRAQACSRILNIHSANGDDGNTDGRAGFSEFFQPLRWSKAQFLWRSEYGPKKNVVCPIGLCRQRFANAVA